jgi:anti-sigma factor RsiW
MGFDASQPRSSRSFGCPSAQRLRAWMDGELEPRLEAEVSLHVGLCAKCRSQAHEERRVARMLRSGAMVLAGRSPRLDARRILERSRRAREQEAQTVGFLKRISAAAALLIVASGMAIAWHDAGGSRQAEATTSIRAFAARTAGMACIDEENSFAIVMGR